MAVLQTQGGFVGAGSSWTLPIPALTGAIHRSIWFSLPVTHTAEMPAGYTSLVDVAGENVRLVAFQKTISASQSAETLTITIRNVSTSAVESAPGVMGYLLTNKKPKTVVTKIENQYVGTHSSPLVTATLAENLAVSVIAAKFPRTWYTPDVTEQFDLCAPFGPSMAFGSAQPGVGATGPYAWTPVDPYDVVASGADQYVAVSVLFDDSGVVAPPVDPPTTPGTVSSNDIGTIEIVEVAEIEWSYPSTWSVGTQAPISIVVTGTDGLPFEGMQVSIAVSGVSSSATTVTTDANGRATFNITPTSSGIKTVTVTAAGVIRTITQAVSAGVNVSISAMEVSVTQGETITINGRAIDAAAVRIHNAAIAWVISGVSYTDVTTGYSVTDAQGSFTRTIRTTGFGTLTATASVQGVASNSVSIPVAEHIVVVPPAPVVTTIRVRGVTYSRIREIRA